jgi:cytochrome c peroxidase
MKLKFSKISLIALFISAVLFTISCNKFKNSPIKETYLDKEEPDYGFKATEPTMNSKIHLGRVLFYDKSMSKNNSISCASCHKQEHAFADNVAGSIGFENRKTPRNSIAIQNLLNTNFITPPNFGFGAPLFWDGRETDLNSLMTKPIANHIEMGMDDMDALMLKLNKLPYYSELVKKLNVGTDKLDIFLLKESMVLFLSQIRTDDARFDRIKAGINPETSSALELRGESLFNTTYQCTNCHHPGPGVYMQNDFANIGLDVNSNDKGRMNVTNASADLGTFKVPDLHNVVLTAPYMHDGRFATLDDVLEHYSRNIKPNSNLDDRLKNNDGTPISLKINDDDKKAIIAFLGTLTDYKMITNPKLSNPFKLK